MGGKFHLTRKQWCILGTLGSVNFANAICASLQAPFFPKEAELKGSTATEYGLVFGIYELVSFIICPFYGRYMKQIGAKVVLTCGILLAGISIVGFGLLDLLDSHVPFITMAFIMRILESLGCAAAITASYSIIGVIFSDTMATAFAIMKGFFGLGFMLGPTIGGYLYQVGGYMCPFMVVGAILLIQALIVFFLLPSVDDQRNLGLSHVRICSVLMLLPVFLDFFGTTAAAMALGFLSATLEPHLREFDLTPVTIGSIFMISSGIYVLLAPLVGYLCDTRLNPKKVIIFGSMLVIIGVSLIGPAPFLPLENTLWIVCLGLAFNGLGYGCILIPSFIDAIHSAVALGLPNDLALYSVVCGLSQSAFALGDAIGPSIAGVLFDTVGFPNGTLVLLAMHAILLVAMTCYVSTEKKDKGPLLKELSQSYGSLRQSQDEADYPPTAEYVY